MDTINVLHFNQFDVLGGAAVAAYRLHQKLLEKKVSSKLLVGNKTIDNDLIELVPRKYRIENQIQRFTKRLGLNHIHHIGTFDIPKHQFYQDADVLNFHNLHTDYFNYLAIPHLTKSKPTIFTLHDMWSFTGQCAYSLSCNKWQTGCHKCRCSNSYQSAYLDSPHLEWMLKKWVYQQSKLTIVTPSRWLKEQAQLSILKHFPIHHIPNGLDVAAYQPIDSILCKKLLDIPQQKKVLLFAVENLKYSRKGGDLLLESVKKLSPSIKEEIVLLTFGNGSEEIATKVGIPVVSLGYITSDRLKSIAYSAADLCLFPTRADNLPLVLQESMACATPMVSFSVGGVSDLVRHGITGYLAKAEDADDFCYGIMMLLENEELRLKMSTNCRQVAVNEYSLERQTNSYIELYNQVIKTQNFSNV